MSERQSAREVIAHVCEVCFRPSLDHDENGHFPPLCCHGCPCGESAPTPQEHEPGESG